MPTAKRSQSVELPNKKYFTIGEVSKLCEVKTHVLRYWEQVFPQLAPTKRQGRRYYQQREVELVLEIKSLLHEQGFTISGAKSQLNQHRTRSEPLAPDEPHAAAINRLQTMKQELVQFKAYLEERF